MAKEDNTKKETPKVTHDSSEPAGTTDDSGNVTRPAQPNVPADSTSTSGTMKKKPLSKAAFARLALVASSDELKPIRRPLPSELPFQSDSEESSEKSTSPQPKHSKSSHPFYNPDESDSNMSPGLSPTPSPEHQTVRPSLSQPGSNNQLPATMSHYPNSPEDNEIPNIIPNYTPLRRGFVTPDTDFDALIHFARDAPKEEREDSKKSKKDKGKGKAVERSIPSLNCSSSTETPLMSWLRRAKEIGLKPDPSSMHPESRGHSSSGGGTMGESSAGMSGTHSSTGAGTMGDGGAARAMNGAARMGSGERGQKKAKRAARRTRGVPKRSYTWKDPTRKNKSGKRDPDAKGKGKGKEREM
ncbi:hypothetical protein V8E51_015918 [Hyaloscypha variabilis]